MWPNPAVLNTLILQATADGLILITIFNFYLFLCYLRIVMYHMHSTEELVSLLFIMYLK